MRRRSLLGAGLALPGLATAATWPDRPLRLVVPFAAGGPADAVARVTMEAASTALGHRVTVENRPGAGVVIGTEAVARAPADGSTFLWTTVAHAVSPALAARLPYDADQDFRGVALTGTVPLVLVVAPHSPARDLPGLIALLKARPGGYDYGTAGIGSAQHLGGVLLAALVGLEMNAVPYRGNPSALTDLMAGRLAFVIESTASTLPLVGSGALRALAVTGAHRTAVLPDVPTMAEAGVPGYEAYTWNAVLARTGTPRHALEGMNAAINAGLRRPGIAARLRGLGVEVTDDTTPASTHAFLRAQAGRWRPLLAAAGVRPE